MTVGPPAAFSGGVPDGLWPRPQPGAFRHRMGLRPLDPAAWLHVDADAPATLAMKAHLLAERGAEVLQAGPADKEAARELLALVVDHLRSHWPDHWAAVAAELDGPAADERHPLDLAGRLVQEDLCLHRVIDGRVVLTAASLCSPNRWRLSDKIGLPMTGIHGPVPAFDGDLGDVVDTTLARLPPERPVWRANWGLVEDPALYQPLHGGVGALAVTAPDDAADRLWLRVERQTLRRLPATGAVVFTIRTYQTPLRTCAGRPDDAAALAAVIAQLPPDVARHKNVSTYAGPVVAWLSACAGAPAAPSA